VSFPNLERRLDVWLEAIAKGHEIGNHTDSHPCSGNFHWSRTNALEEYTLERMEEELARADAHIQELTGVTPRTFAYPCGQKYVGRGQHTQSYVPLIARRFLAGRGFRDESPNDPVYCDLAQAAAVDGDDLPFEQYRKWVDRAVEEGGWVIFAAHEVGAGGIQTTRLDALDALCRYCADPANGVWIDTVAAIGAYIRQFRTE
jgi:peptidoglycan/xylan/chitin deacetylase (PgdA/CDA1 family)